MMTPEYASPEQIRAEETSPLTDLYSLGVILYELLTGRRPYRLKSRIFHEVVRVVCEQPVTRPSSVVLEPEERLGDHGKTLTIAPGLLSQAREGSPNDLKRRLSGDLDGILLKALEKAPRDRYRSVDQFSSDLDRHLNGQPVLAGGGGRFEAITLALSRHRLTVVAAVALLLALYVGGIRVDWRGFAVLSGAAALLGLWHLATDRTFGAAFSERVYGMSAPIVVVGGFALIIAITATNRYFGRWTELPLTRTILLWVMILGAIYVIGLITAWFVRGRWAGALQFEERQPPNRAWMASIVLFANMGNLLHDLGIGGPRSTQDLTTWTEVLLLLCAQVYILRISNRFEVRDRGLMVGGRLISWLNIESYEWEGVASPEDLVSLNIRQKRAVLRLNVRRLFAFIPPPRIRISDSRQALLEDVLNRHLSVWPGEIKHGAGPLPQ